MKKVICLWLALSTAYGSLKLSSFEEWVKKTNNYLTTNGEIVNTSLGPIQYVFFGDKNDPVVVSLHGMFGGWDQAYLIGQHLLDQGFSLLTLSRPGYLASKFTSSDLMTKRDQAHAIMEMLKALKIERAAVIGYSDGAPVALNMAKLYPEKIWGLILESLESKKDDVPLYAFLKSFLNYEIVTQDRSSLDLIVYSFHRNIESDFYSSAKKILAMDGTFNASRLEERLSFVMDDQKQSEFLNNWIFSLSPISERLEGIKNDFILASLGPWPKATSFYRKMITPTLIIQGINDTKDNYTLAKTMQSKIKNARLISVKNSGHFIWLGPEAKIWQKEVAEFLKKYSKSHS